MLNAEFPDAAEKAAEVEKPSALVSVTETVMGLQGLQHSASPLAG